MNTNKMVFDPDIPAFEKFPKIARFSRPIVITEKIDGTNAQIYIDENNVMCVGSRKRWLTVLGDNFGFYAWAFEHQDELITGLGPGRHYGEWWGHKIQRGYGLDERRFSLFNVFRWQSPRLMVDYPAPELMPDRQRAPDCCHVAPVLWATDTLGTVTIASVLDQLKRKGSAAAPGFMDPEGIVICHVASGHLYKKTFVGEEGVKGRP